MLQGRVGAVDRPPPIRDGDNAPSARTVVLLVIVFTAFLIGSFVAMFVVGDENDDVCIEASSHPPTSREVPC